VTAVVDLSDTFSEVPTFLGLKYLHLPVLDLTSPTRQQVDEAVAFISEHIDHGICYVHCKVGYSRSAGVVGAWLLATRRTVTVEQTIEELRARRPAIVIRPEIRSMLENYARSASG
jgi:protein-tyrosine phosphatase